MIIRCERCSTLYELEETLLAPEGSQVQCTRCQAVFTAVPPRSQARPLATPPGAATPAVVLAQPEHPTAQARAPGGASSEPPAADPVPAWPHAAPAPAPEEPALVHQASPPEDPPAHGRAVEAPLAGGRAGGPAGPAASAGAPRSGGSGASIAPRPTRTGPNVYRRPAPSGLPMGGATRPAGAVRRGTVGAFEARAQLSTLWKKLLLPALGLALAGLVVGAFLLWRSRPDPEALRLRAEASARLAQDDAESLARGVRILDELLSRGPSEPGLEVERALGRLLQAAAQLEEAEPFEAQATAAGAERGRLLLEQPPGFEDGARLLAVEGARLDAEVAPRRKAAAALTAQATAELQRLASAPGGEAPAAGARAVAAALAGDPAEVARLAGLARLAGGDPWAELAEGWVELRPEGARDQALARLGALARARPELLRARFLLARAQAAQGRREEALTTLGGLLAANPRHERAQRFKSRLASPPPAPPPAAAAPAAPVRSPVPRPAGAGAGQAVTPRPAADTPPPPAAAAAAAPAPAAPAAPTPEPSGLAPLPEPTRIVMPPPGPPRPAPRAPETPGGG
ncbi:MAG: zinc-ribbon domain-containing protein [Anaeromyxobacter sp.]|nr:zinc-ribbon domain-containing protein [Anaeromyxobacter sp.]